MTTHITKTWFDGEKLVTQEIPDSEVYKQEPVVWRYDLKHNGSFAGVSTEYSPVKLSIGENWRPLYTTPPQRPWVGLTDEEAQWLYDNCRTPSNLIDMVEAKLKDKNT